MNTNCVITSIWILKSNSISIFVYILTFVTGIKRKICWKKAMKAIEAIEAIEVMQTMEALKALQALQSLESSNHSNRKNLWNHWKRSKDKLLAKMNSKLNTYYSHTICAERPPPLSGLRPLTRLSARSLMTRLNGNIIFIRNWLVVWLVVWDVLMESPLRVYTELKNNNIWINASFIY